jgi:hypothetical protein
MLAYKWECLGHRAATKRLGCERRGSTSLQANRHPYDGILLAFPSSGKLGNDPTFQGIRCGWNRLASPLASALGGIVGTFDRARGLLRSQGFAMPIDDDTITRIKRAVDTGVFDGMRDRGLRLMPGRRGSKRGSSSASSSCWKASRKYRRRASWSNPVVRCQRKSPPRTWCWCE